MFEKKVCKGCGKSGVFLKLNDDLLCSECAELESKRMTTKEVVDELVAYANGAGTTKKIEDYLDAEEAKNKREKRNFNRVFGNYEKARSFEKSGEVEKALAIYLKLLDNCPTGTDYYVRPCIILEKQKDYKKAIEICDMAIACIRQGRFKADETEFLKRKERLVKKLEKK